MIHFNLISTFRRGCVCAAVFFVFQSAWAEPLQVATFEIDATPPIGGALCNGLVQPAKVIVTPLTGRGLILAGAGQPIVLCAFDWVAIANETHDVMRAALAKAVNTSIDRVTVHTLHQHDAPGTDFATERILAEHGLGGKYSNPEFDRDVVARLEASARAAMKKLRPVTHVGLGTGLVEKVASNRRVLGPNGRVVIQRNSASKSPGAKTAPEGTIDPLLRLISFWDGATPIAVCTYYATHPQSYYGKGGVSWDFVGMARALREKALPGVPHIHFNGAGGNVAAGKYNDGAPEMRAELATRLADGMGRAWDAQNKSPVSAEAVKWKATAATLPLREELKEKSLEAKLRDPKLAQGVRIRAGRDLAYARRVNAGQKITMTCLQLGEAHVVHMPGELFVEYQLAAQKMKPQSFVAMAAYGDSGPGYIGTEIAYSQGGYETGIVSRTAPTVERVLMAAMKQLLVP